MMGHLIWCYWMFHQAQIIFELALDINQAKDQADELTLYVG